jgi:TPP-dependent indolepyruvate ferredoxin oxidoreductase alpha subunit
VRKPRVASGFPTKIDHALRYSRVVVVAVTVPGAPVDALVRREARAGADAGRAGFVALSAANERAVSALVAQTGVLPAPAVVIVKRPGVVTSTFSVTDAGTVAQAVAQARR